MPPIIEAHHCKPSFIRFAYTKVARSGRWPASPPGEWSSCRRIFFTAVNLLSIESRFPAVTRDAGRGLPEF